MTTAIGQLAEMNEQAQAGYLAEEQREWAQLQRRAEAEQARAVAWVESQVVPELDARFDAAIAAAQQQLDAARADLAEARRALDAHAAARPTDRADVAMWARRRAELHAELEAFEGIAGDAQAVLHAAVDARRVELLRIWSERGRAAEAALEALRQQWTDRIVQAEQALRDVKTQAETELTKQTERLGWLRHHRPA